jgi:hypothetical protein
MNSPFLRRALLLDAVATGATGLLMLAAAGILQELLQVPGSLLREAGIILLPFAAVVLYLGTRERPSERAVATVIVINVLWVLASFGLLVSGAISPNILGYGFIVMQAVAVAVFAELQYVGLRRKRAAAA